jgi:hypothetical protein
VACLRCSSEHQKKLTAEMNVHFPGREGLNKPTVWLFPEVTFCLNCGLAEFSVARAELSKLAGPPDGSAENPIQRPRN